MKELLRVDGVTVSVGSDGVVWLAVVDGAGTHSTSLTDDGIDLLRITLSELLMSGAFKQTIGKAKR